MLAVNAIKRRDETIEEFGGCEREHMIMKIKT